MAAGDVLNTAARLQTGAPDAILVGRRRGVRRRRRSSTARPNPSSPKANGAGRRVGGASRRSAPLGVDIA